MFNQRLLYPSQIYTGSAVEISPSSYSDLELWLDGDDPDANGIQPADSSAATGWTDKSSNGYTWYVSKGSPTYKHDAINSHGGFYFDGNDGFGETIANFPNIGGDCTLIIIYKMSSDQTFDTVYCNGRAFSSRNNTWNYDYLVGWHDQRTRSYVRNAANDQGTAFHPYYSPTFPLTVDHIVTYDASTIKTFVGNVLANSASISTPLRNQTSYAHGLGHSPYHTNTFGYLTGHIAEVIWYSKELTSVERTELYDEYLAPKYAL